MKFYEAINPYYALISAENIEDAIKKYKEDICEMEDDEEFNIEEIDRGIARKKYLHSFHDVGEECSLQTFFRDSSSTNVLLVDSQLV